MADNPSNIVPDNLIVIEGGKQFVPAPAPSDAGKVLGVVNASGDIGWVEDQGGTLTQVQADWAETDPSKVSFIDNKPTIPSKTSDLQNDSGFITSSDIPAIPTKTSDLQNDSGFITSSDVPTKTSELQNDSGFITSADVPAQVQANWSETSTGAASYIQNKPSIPSKTSDLQNDSGFITSSDIPSIPTKTSDLQNDSGFITSADIPAQVQSDWNETNTSSAAYIQNKPTIPPGVIVDQTYNASSTNAQSGVAVAEAIAAIPVAPTYSEGDGIDITNNVISADVDGTTIGIDPTTHKIKSLQSIPTKTSDLQNDSGFITSSDIPAQVQANWNESDSSSAAYIQNKPTIPPGVIVDQTYNASSTNAQSGVAVASAVAGVNAVPASTSSDENKVLTVNSSGTPVWAASSVPASKPLVQGNGITITDGQNDVTISANVDQTYDAASANAQSGVAVASAIAGIRQVPSSTSADEDKVLTVNSSGTPVWAEAQGGGGGGSTTIDYTDDSYWETVLRSKIVTTDSCYAILKFADASYDPSAVSDVTSVFTVTRLSEYSENVWLFERPSSVTSNVFLSSTLITVNYEILSLAYNAPSIGVDFKFVEGYRCTRIGNIFPVPGSSYVTLMARLYITYGSVSVKSIGLIDLSYFRGSSVEWYVGYSYSSDQTVSNLPIASIGGVVAYSWGSMQFKNTFARTKITKAPPFYRYGSGNILIHESEISPAGIDGMFQGCDQMTEIDTVLALQSVTVTPDYEATYNNRYCFEGCRKLSKVAGVKITVYNGASYKPLSLVNMFSLCDSLTYNPLVLAYAPPSGDSSTMHAIYLDKLFYRSGIENYIGAIRCAYNTNWKPVSLESLATTTTSMFEGAYKLTNVSMCFGNESPFYVTKTKVDNMFKYCASLKDTAKLYASLNSVISQSATSSDTQGAFTTAGAFAPDYTTNQSQIPSSWGGTGA